MLCCRCGLYTDGTTLQRGVRSAICHACSTQPAPPARPPPKRRARTKPAPPTTVPAAPRENPKPPVPARGGKKPKRS